MGIETQLLSKIFPGMGTVKVDFEGLQYRYADYGSMRTKPNDLYSICAVIRYFRPSKIFEFGTGDGASTLQFAVNSDETSDIYTFDLEEEDFRVKHQTLIEKSNFEWNPVEEIGWSFKKSRFAHRIHQLCGNSFIYNFEPFYGQMELIFVDGNHRSPFVEKDTDNAFKMLSEKGIILWHDYNDHFPDVKRFLLWLSRQLPIYHIKNTHVAAYLSPAAVRFVDNRKGNMISSNL